MTGTEVLKLRNEVDHQFFKECRMCPGKENCCMHGSIDMLPYCMGKGNLNPITCYLAAVSAVIIERIKEGKNK